MSAEEQEGGGGGGGGALNASVSCALVAPQEVH